MTASDWWALAGAALQLVGLIWAVVAVVRQWRREWPGVHLYPKLASTWATAKMRTRTAWTRLTRRTQSGDVHGPAATGLLGVGGEAVGVARPKPTTEERLTEIEGRLDMMAEHHGEQIRAVRAEMTQIASEVSQKQADHARQLDAQRQQDIRRALAPPAALAIFGAVFQLVAAFT